MENKNKITFGACMIGVVRAQRATSSVDRIQILNPNVQVVADEGSLMSKSDDLAAKIIASQKLIRPLIAWIVKIERHQRERGKLFLAEQPQGCGSWNLKETATMQAKNWSTILDMCQFGTSYKKPTRVWTNAPWLTSISNRCCCPLEVNHEHPQGLAKVVCNDGK